MVSLLCATLLVVGGTLPASAATVPQPDDPSNPLNYVGVEPAPATLEIAPSPGLRSAYLNVYCSLDVQQPHYSSGAGGAIYKSVVTCTGSGAATVNVRVRGLLQWDQASSPSDTSPVSWQTRATSDQTQTVVVNGTGKTYYTPLVGSNGGRGTGFWYATSTVQITSPGLGSVGSDNYLIWKTI